MERNDVCSRVGKPVISVENMVRRYGKDFTAVDNVSFDVKAGEIFAVLGTNGAGKTSTLEVLEGIAKPYSGSVRVFDMDPIAERKLIRPHQGVMMQSGGFPTDLTVRETLRMWAGTLTRPAGVEETLQAVNLEHRADTRVKALSGGELRRLDLGCAILGQPRLLFLDEPTTGLDPQSRRTCWKLIEELNRDGTTIVLTTHYLEEADRLCDRLIIMHEGQVARAGTHAQIVEGYPSTIEVANEEKLHRKLPEALRYASQENNGKLVWKTHELQKDLAALLQWANSENIQLRQLSAVEANLETVFLDIAGDIHS